MNAQPFNTSGAVVLGLDGRPVDEQLEAVTFAAAEANRRQVAIVLAHGCQPLVTTTTLMPPDTLAELERTGRKLLAAAMDVVSRQIPPELQIEIRLGQGTGVNTLLELSDTAGVIVLQRRNVGALTRWRTGSTTTRVAAEANCPVVVVRGRHNDEGNGRGVVCGVDGRGHAGFAIEAAFAEASRRQTPLIAVHAWLTPDLPLTYGYIPPDPEEIRVSQERSSLDLAEALAGYSALYPDVVVQQRVVNGAPHQVLDDACHGAELLVVGRHGGGHRPTIAVGSVALHAIRHLNATATKVEPSHTCPVMIVPPTRSERHGPPHWMSTDILVGPGY